MSSFPRPSRRGALIAGVAGLAGLAVIGALGVGTAAIAATEAPTTPDASSAPTDGERPARVPQIGGETLAVSGSTITVEDRDGFTRTIELADDVTVTEDGETSSASAIEVGDHIRARGAVADDGTTLDATEVQIGEQGQRDGGRDGGPGRGAKGGSHERGAPADAEDESVAPTPDGSTE